MNPSERVGMIGLAALIFIALCVRIYINNFNEYEEVVTPEKEAFHKEMAEWNAALKQAAEERYAERENKYTYNYRQRNKNSEYKNSGYKEYKPYEKSEYTKTETYKKEESVEIVELNSADTAALRTLVGIGERLASRIVQYRERLGGFYKIEQLAEVYNLPMEVVEKNRHRLTVNKQLIKKVRVNKDDFKTILRHPYIEYEHVKGIFDYRRLMQNVESFDDLVKNYIIPAENREKLEIYLDFTPDLKSSDGASKSE